MSFYYDPMLSIGKALGKFTKPNNPNDSNNTSDPKSSQNIIFYL